MGMTPWYMVCGLIVTNAITFWMLLRAKKDLGEAEHRISTLQVTYDKTREQLEHVANRRYGDGLAELD